MEQKTIEILSRHRLMAVATVRSDGWPQNTIVGYVNDGLLLYFLISRSSQKFANIAQDNRVSIAIGGDFKFTHNIEGISAAAWASEVTEMDQREHAYRLLVGRHPEYGAFSTPDYERAAVMRARCEVVTVIDYSQGFGHADVVNVGAGGIVSMTAARPDNWGLTPAAEPLTS